jgi:hypothetical protein
MRLVLRALEWSGGMSAEERKQLDADALRLVKSAVAEDDGAICSSMVAHLTEGLIDLDKWEDTAQAYERLRRHFQ